MNKIGVAINSLFGNIISMGMSSSIGIEIGSIGINTPHHIRYSYIYFSGTKIRGIRAGEGKTISFNFTSKVKKGELRMQIMNPDQVSPIQLAVGITGTSDIKTQKNGIYKLVISGTNTEGGFDISWVVK